MALVTRLFQIEREEHVIVLTPEPHPLEFAMRDLQEEMDEILASCEDYHIWKLLIDCPPNERFESMALGFLVSLHMKVAEKGGRVVCCCRSSHFREILATTRLDSLIPVFDSRDEALGVLNNSA